MCSCMYFLAYAGQPAVSSFIPPSVDSIILDYQSPNAQPGFYPNEDPNDGGIGEVLVSAVQAIPSRLMEAGWKKCAGVCMSQKPARCFAAQSDGQAPVSEARVAENRFLVACR